MRFLCAEGQKEGKYLGKMYFEVRRGRFETEEGNSRRKKTVQVYILQTENDEHIQPYHVDMHPTPSRTRKLRRVGTG